MNVTMLEEFAIDTKYMYTFTKHSDHFHILFFWAILT